jgi:hypothetical protein
MSDLDPVVLFHVVKESFGDSFWPLVAAAPDTDARRSSSASRRDSRSCSARLGPERPAAEAGCGGAAGGAGAGLHASDCSAASSARCW